MKNSQKGFVGLPVLIMIVLGLVIVGGGAYFVVHQQSQPKANQPTTSATPSTVSTTDTSNQNVIQCGSVNQKILTQYDYQPTETEKGATIKSLTCINQALIKCSSSLLIINNENKIVNVTVKGQGKLGCNVSVQKTTGEIMTCPLPADYVVDLQKKFTASNFDATIVTDLITNINAEISAGNKSGNCTVTK